MSALCCNCKQASHRRIIMGWAPLLCVLCSARIHTLMRLGKLLSFSTECSAATAWWIDMKGSCEFSHMSRFSYPFKFASKHAESPAYLKPKILIGAWSKVSCTSILNIPAILTMGWRQQMRIDGRTMDLMTKNSSLPTHRADHGRVNLGTLRGRF